MDDEPESAIDNLLSSAVLFLQIPRRLISKASNELDELRSSDARLAVECAELRRERDALAAEIKALREQEPVGYQDTNSIGEWQSCTEWQKQLAIDDGRNTRDLYAAPVPAQDVARDAERYRWLRDGGINRLKYDDYGVGPSFDLEEELDETIDAAMLAAAQKKEEGQ